MLIAAALGVLAETVLRGSQLAPGDLDLIARGECLGTGRCDLLTHQVDHPHALGIRLAENRVAAVLERDVAGSQVHDRPEEAHVEVGSPAEMGQGWRHDIAAAAEHSGAVAQPDRWNPRACQLFMVMDLCSRNIRGPRRQVGPVLKGIRDQIVGGGVQCDQVDRDKRSPRGAEADRGIEIEPVGQSSGSDGDGLLGALDGGPAQLPVGLRG